MRSPFTNEYGFQQSLHAGIAIADAITTAGATASLSTAGTDLAAAAAVLANGRATLSPIFIRAVVTTSFRCCQAFNRVGPLQPQSDAARPEAVLPPSTQVGEPSAVGISQLEAVKNSPSLGNAEIKSTKSSKVDQTVT